MSNAQASTFTDSALSDKVKEFLIRFKDKHGNYKYVNAIDEMMPKNAKYIIVDYNDLVVEPQIEIIFSQNPDRLFDAFSRAIKEALQTRFSDYAEKIKDEVRVRLINFPLERSLRQITAETIGHITSVSGMVVRASEVKPLAKELVFVCPDEHPTKVIQLKGMDVKLPVVCDNPNCKHRDFELKPEASKFIDFQILRLQELPEDLPPGQLPHYIDVTTRQDLVDNSRPGDRIILTGVVRVEQESVAGVQRGHSGLYRLRIEGNNIEFLSGRGSKTDGETVEVVHDYKGLHYAFVDEPAYGVDAGLINQEFLDAERERLGPMYPMYYECDFYNSSSTWYRPEMFQYGEYGEDM